MNLETWIYLFLAIVAVFVVVGLLVRASESARSDRLQKFEGDYQTEFTKLTAAQVEGDLFWIRSPIGDPRAATRADLLQLYANGDISLDTEIAPDAPVSSRVYRSLREEIPALESVRRRS